MAALTTAPPSARDGVRSLDRSQLRIATAGSVDDGKSTLIGRLLFDTKTIFEDQLDAVTKASRRYGDLEFNLALLTDGLRAEREQGITIDVAFRYFSTPVRSFVLADTPGHVQYTRNMVTGASSADVAIVLVDARHGVVAQTRRHLGVCALVGVRHVVLAVNKMDLVEWDEARYRAIGAEVGAIVDDLAAQFATTIDLHLVPVSALLGDNIVDGSVNTPWYGGPTLLHLLETIDADDDVPDAGARLAVQWVIRSGADYRGFAGQLAGGTLHVGDEVVCLPGGLRSTVRGIGIGGAAVVHAGPGDAVAVELSDQIDVGRGDVLVHAAAALAPQVTDTAVVDVCWMVEEPLRAGATLVAKHLARQVQVQVEEILHCLDPDTLSAVAAHELALNDLARVRVRFASPVAADRYDDVRVSGRLVLIDPATNTTAGAAIIRSC